MAWPYDAKDFTFASGLYVPSSTLNEIQDKIIDLHEEHTGQSIWIPIHDDPGQSWYRNYGGTDPDANESWIQCAVADSVIYIEVDDWPEWSTVNSITVDWNGSVGGGISRRLKMYVARHIWGSDGSTRTMESLHSVNNSIESLVGGGRDQMTLTPDQNNTLMSHSNHKLVIAFYSNDVGGAQVDYVYGVRLNVDFYGTNKWFNP